MSPEKSSDDQNDPHREQRRPQYGPLRLVLPWVSVLVGVIFVIRNQEPLFLVLGLALIAAGVVAFFVYRYMARRNL